MKQQFLIGFIAIAAIFSACSEKNESALPAKLEIRLTDDPLDVDAVYIDIQEIKVNLTADPDKGWQTIPDIQQGVYNLLDLVNDKDTLLARAEIPSGKLHQLRLVLGPQNSIVINGQQFPLETPSAQQSGLKLNIQQEVSGGVLYTILLDFDAARSIVSTGNGKYLLKPVIRTALQAAGGSVSGNIQPPGVLTAVYALQGNDTIATTFTNAAGNYLIKGVAPGAYDLHFLPADPAYVPDSRNGIIVTTGKVTVVDTLFLHP